MNHDYDCQKCGACCSYKWSWPVLRKDFSDSKSIPESMIRDDYPLMKTINNRCVALNGEVGKCVSCDIYQFRPQSCIRFQPGSDLCKEARQHAGLVV